MVVLVVAMVSAICGRGPWYDEFFTHYVTRPCQGLSSLWPVWLGDNHPPLFYFLTWATNFLGDSFVQRRTVNLAFFVIGGAAVLLLYRTRPAFRSLAIPYGIALASYLPAIDRVSELRSNFLAYVAAAVAVAALSELARPNQSPRSLRALVFLTLALAVALSVHLAATMIVGAVGAAFGLRLLLMRDWRGTRELAVAGTIAAAPFVGIMALQLGAIAQNTQNFWVPAGLDGARWAIENEIVANLAANWPLTVTGVTGLAILGMRVLRDRRLSDQASLAVTLGVGIVLAIVVLVAAHLQRPFVIDRYLVSLHAPMAMLLATGVVTVVECVAGSVAVAIDLLMVAGALFAIHANLQRTLARPSWNGTGAAIARIVANCPGTIVHVAMSWNEPVREMPPIENRAVFPYAYNWVARSYGFGLAPPASKEIAKGCPTVFWAEHLAGQHPTTEIVRGRLRQMGFAVHSGHLERIGDGWIYVVPSPLTSES
ncbi:hypothetical protein [Novosphingobium sp. Rr 2-17]|uniref:hypothetical protein n=1 Tax=Novosphingobium sp. Rr 2-17 TaxID=555793 RepID=UPI001ED8EC63|nr:hypothetical protein [Novosphingobium sp. Rr 2-17]